VTEALVPTPPVCSLSALDAKANSAFPGLVVRKDLVGRVRGNAVVPGYVLEFLLAQYCATDDEATIEAGIESVRDILAQHYVHRGEAELIKSTIRDRGRYRIIDKASVVLDDKKDIHTVAFANLGLKGVPVDDGTVKRHPKLLTGGVWCMADIEYAPGEAHEDRWSIAGLKPIQLGQFDADTYVATRAEFTTDEWIDLLTHTIGFAPEKLSRRAKLLQLVRLIPFVERNYNLVELGPKGTGKSHIYSEFSPHGMLISGGEVTVPKLFVNNANGRIGLVGFWDVVAFDEFAGQKRVDKSLVDIMKNYMANKTFSRGVETIGAEASMVFIGNTSRPVPAMLAHSDLFEALPESYHDSAYLDRLHHYLPGWELEIIRRELFTDGYGFVVDYLAEALAHFRSQDFSDVSSPHFTLSEDISTRDRDGIRKTFSGLMKLIHPHRGATIDETEELLRLAIEGRKRVKDQILRIDHTMEAVRFGYTESNGTWHEVATQEELDFPQFYPRDAHSSDQVAPSATTATATGSFPGPLTAFGQPRSPTLERETVTASAGTVIRTVKVFSWDEVDATLTRALLVAAYRATGQDDEVAQLTKMDTKGLARQAELSLGRPLAAAHMTTPGIVDVLMTRWLPELSIDELDELVWEIQLSLSGPDRSVTQRTKGERLRFIRGRNNTVNLRNNLRAAFLRAHKTSRPVSRSATGDRAQRRGVQELVGVASAPSVQPYPHQSLAWTKLDELAESTKARRAGLLVLPTGSGKTFTIVHWLLQRMEKDPQLRVLWLADQQELLEQAAIAFERDAAAMPADFLRCLRVIHSEASPATALADEELDVACVTRQSLVGGGAAVALPERLKQFLKRPTIVVVDEAHHAVASTYQQLLDLIEHIAPRTLLLGLTATPWPSGQGMTQRLNQLFPNTLISVDTLRLIGEGILAQPVLHTVATDEYVRLEASERALISKSDFPPSILARLDHDRRNALVVATWTERDELWGKTLVFAGTIAHAEHLAEAFTTSGVRCLVLHSQSKHHRSHVLREFRDAVKPLVLISVGMLLEGVDLPDARTAILARPTLSRVLMRQMIGRVLRGPLAGGEAVAHIVALEDHWVDGIDVLSPVDLREMTRPDIEVDAPVGVHRLPPIVDELTGEAVAENILRRIQRAYDELAGNPTVAVGAATLAGYYQLTDLNVPVFEHSHEIWEELIDAKLAGRKLPVRSARDMFGDLAVPRPTSHDVDAVLDYVASTKLRPQLIELRVTFSVRSCAQRLLAEAAMTE